MKWIDFKIHLAYMDAKNKFIEVRMYNDSIKLLFVINKRMSVHLAKKALSSLTNYRDTILIKCHRKR